MRQKESQLSSQHLGLLMPVDPIQTGRPEGDNYTQPTSLLYTASRSGNNEFTTCLIIAANGYCGLFLFANNQSGSKASVPTWHVCEHGGSVMAFDKMVTGGRDLSSFSLYI